MSPSPIPRPYPTDLGDVVHVPPSPSSSSGTSTDTYYRRDGSRRDSRRDDSRLGVLGDPRRGESYESRPTSRSESRHLRTSSPRRSSRPASGPLIITVPWSQTDLKSLKSCPAILMGDIQVCLSDCLTSSSKNRLFKFKFTLLHLQYYYLLRHLRRL